MFFHNRFKIDISIIQVTSSTNSFRITNLILPNSISSFISRYIRIPMCHPNREFFFSISIKITI